MNVEIGLKLNEFWIHLPTNICFLLFNDPLRNCAATSRHCTYLNYSNVSLLTINHIPFSCLPTFFLLQNIDFSSFFIFPSFSHLIFCRDNILVLHFLKASSKYCNAPSLFKVLTFYVPISIPFSSLSRCSFIQF